MLGRYAGKADALLLTDDAAQGVSRNQHVRCRLHRFQGEALLRVQEALGGYANTSLHLQILGSEYLDVGRLLHYVPRFHAYNILHAVITGDI